MRWDMGRRSDNIEDRRGMGLPLGIAGGGIGTVVLLVLALCFGVDRGVILQGGGEPPAVERGTDSPSGSPASDPARHFVSVVLADTEDAWIAGAAVGPFYCPGDSKLYLDLAFFRDGRGVAGASPVESPAAAR